MMVAPTHRSHLHTVFPWLDDDHVTRLWLVCGYFMAVLWLIIIPAYLSDARMVDGVSTWAKPLKFAISLSVHAFTMAFLAQLLLRRDRAGITMSVAGFAGVAAILYEQLYIMIQAARARRSHFNFETQFESMMYAVMGIGAVLLVVTALVLGIMIWRKAEASMPALKLGAVLGLVIGSLLTLIFAGYMSSSSSHWVGASVSDANGLPIFGWSREVGDLRVAHFIATHMMQTLPIIGLVADKARWSQGRLLVWIAAIVQVLLAVAVFGQALNGQPLIPL